MGQQSVIHRIFKCSNCLENIHLSDQDLRGAFEYCKVDPESAELIIVCNRCGHAAKYAMPAHPQAAYRSDKVDCEFDQSLHCDNLCGKLPSFRQSYEGMTEPEIRAEGARIVWQNIQCSNGHEIGRPPESYVVAATT